MEKLNLKNMLIIPKLIYKCNEITFKSQLGIFFMDLDKLSLQICMEEQKIQKSWDNFEKDKEYFFD